MNCFRKFFSLLKSRRLPVSHYLYRRKYQYAIFLIQISLFLGFISCHQYAKNSIVLQKNSNQRIADNSQLKSEFEHEIPVLLEELDQFAGHWSFQGLRKKNLEEDEVEIRIWVGFGPDITRGLILTNTSNKGHYLPPISEDINIKSNSKTLLPRSGFNQFWGVIENSGLLKIPNNTIVVENEPFIDSDVIIVEVKKGEKYNRLMYAAVCHSNTLEARQILSLLTHINKEFSISFYKCD